MFRGQHLQTEEWFRHGRPQQGHGTTQLYDASGVTALMDHLIDPRSPQPRMPAEGLTNELHIRVGDRGAYRLRTFEAVRLDGIANGIRVHVKFACDGADFPVLGVKVTAYLYVGFLADHLFSLPRRGIRGNGSTNRPLRPQTMQRRNGAGRPTGRYCAKSAPERAGAVSGPDPDVPQKDFAGEQIDWEP